MVQRVDYPLAQYADEAHPLLHLATREIHPATNTKIEWLVNGPGGIERWENHTQIVRTSFRKSDDRETWRNFERHLDAIEAILWDGVPREWALSSSCYPAPPGTCGGARHFLGRDPLVSDKLYLRPLKDCILRTFEDSSYAEPTSQFLTEFSLQVVPTQRIRRR